MFRLRRPQLWIGGPAAALIAATALLFTAQPASANWVTMSQGGMEGSLTIMPGDRFFGGFDFQVVTSGHAATTVEFDNASVKIPYSCQTSNGTYAGFITIPIPAAGIYTIPANDTSNWYPSGVESSYLVWQSGIYTVPALCGAGNPMYTTDKGIEPAQVKNPTFTADVFQDSPATPLYDLQVRWHYRDPNAKGNGNTNDCSQPGADSTACAASWSGTATVTADAGPGNLVPEVPLVILLPLAALAVLGTAVYIYRRPLRTGHGIARS